MTEKPEVCLDLAKTETQDSENQTIFDELQAKSERIRELEQKAARDEKKIAELEAKSVRDEKKIRELEGGEEKVEEIEMIDENEVKEKGQISETKKEIYLEA